MTSNLKKESSLLNLWNGANGLTIAQGTVSLLSHGRVCKPGKMHNSLVAAERKDFHAWDERDHQLDT
jgi:hypothetical protein